MPSTALAAGLELVDRVVVWPRLHYIARVKAAAAKPARWAGPRSGALGGGFGSRPTLITTLSITGRSRMVAMVLSSPLPFEQCSRSSDNRCLRKRAALTLARQSSHPSAAGGGRLLADCRCPRVPAQAIAIGCPGGGLTAHARGPCRQCAEPTCSMVATGHPGQ